MGTSSWHWTLKSPPTGNCWKERRTDCPVEAPAQPSTCSRPLEEVDSPAPAPAVEWASVVAASAMVDTVALFLVVLVMVALSPSQQSQKLTHAECIKKESSPSSLSETLDLNLYPFTVLCIIIKHVQPELKSEKSVIPKVISD